MKIPQFLFLQICLVFQYSAHGQICNIDSLAKVLDTILTDDQSYRIQMEAIETKYGLASNEFKKIKTTVIKYDSINLSKVEKILDKFGWLDPVSFGDEKSYTLFLVIQHSPLVIQIKYLPLLRSAVKEGKAKSRTLALLEDRIAVGQGERQIYGTQVMTYAKSGEFFVYPIWQPEDVDNRRKLLGLQPIVNYLNKWHIKWDLEQYKLTLPRIEEILRSERFGYKY